MTYNELIEKLKKKSFDAFSLIIIYLDSLGFDVIAKEGYSLGVLYRGESYCSPLVLDFDVVSGGKFELVKTNLKESDLIKRYEKSILEGLNESNTPSVHVSTVIDFVNAKKLASHLTQAYSSLNSFEKFLFLVKSQIESLPKERKGSVISMWDSAIQVLGSKDKLLDTSELTFSSAVEEEPEPSEGDSEGALEEAAESELDSE